jgi:hypothetical protein
MQAKALFQGRIVFGRSGPARRVKRSEVFVTANVKPDGLNACLDCWKLYMSSDDRDLSASRMKFIGSHADQDTENVEGYASDLFDEQWKADMRIGAATNAAIESLKMLYRCAIYKKCGIAKVFSFPHSDFMATLIEAEEQLATKLKNNIATATLF